MIALTKNMNVVAYKAATMDDAEIGRLLVNVNEALERLNSLPHIFSDAGEGDEK